MLIFFLELLFLLLQLLNGLLALIQIVELVRLHGPSARQRPASSKKDAAGWVGRPCVRAAMNCRVVRARRCLLYLDPVIESGPGSPGRHELVPATITVTRTSEEDFKQRQLIVHIDGEKSQVRCSSAMSVSRDVEPGPHVLRVSNTLVWKTVEFVAGPGEQIFFEVINRAGFLTYPMLMILGVGPLYVTIRRM